MKWSYSAHNARRRCQRQFTFSQIVASHNARHPERREAFILKQLQHLSAWQGSVVHRVLATRLLHALQTGLPFDWADMQDAALKLARRQFAFSEAGHYRDPNQTKTRAGDAHCALFEHEFGWEISPQVLAEAYANISRCFEHLAGQAELLQLLRRGANHMAERPIPFQFNGLSVIAMPDLVLWLGRDTPVIVDWKIGKSESSDYSQQLYIYALALMRCGWWPQITPERISLFEVNLAKDEVRRQEVTAQHMDDIEDLIYRSSLEQETLIGCGKFESLSWDDLDVANSPNTCMYCNFHPLCTQRLQGISLETVAEPALGRRQ